jgi:hypothetical protein
MAQHSAAEDQVIDIVLKTRACDLEEMTRQCTNLTWNQVFLAVDRLTRNSEVMLVRASQGTYMVTFPQPHEGRPSRRSLPS